MRSLSLRTSIPFGVALLLSSLAASAAHADTPTTILRGKTPWIRLGGAYAGPRTNDVEVRGRAIVAAQGRTDVSALVTSGVDRFGDGETIVRYAQLHHGLPVIGRGASVRLSPAGQPIASVIDLEADLPSSTSAAVAPTDAARVASAVSHFGATSAEAHLVVWPTLDRGARLAYAVLPRVPAGIPSRPRIIVDAETREVLEARDLVVFAKASMFASNPTKSPSLDISELAMVPVGQSLSNPFIEASSCVDRKSVKPVKVFGFDLDLHMCDLEQRAAPDANGDYIYEPADGPGSAEAAEDPFSEVSIYYHAAKAYAFFRALQGAPEAQVVVDKPLRLVANLRMPAGLMSGDLKRAADPNIPLEPFQNAFFSPAGGELGAVFQQLYGFDTGALWFGQGPTRDFAYDGDVVYHELGHAVVGATLQLGAWHVDARGAIDAPGAMNEGLADYFSSAITGDPEVGEYAAADMGAGAVVRSLANQDRCPTAVTGEVHYDSTLFSGALWQARMQLPEGDRSTFDAAIYKAMRTNPGRGNLGFDDLAKLFLATLKTDLPKGEAALEKAMTDHGVLPACERILPFEEAPITSPDVRIGFTAPSTELVKVKGIAPGIVQVKAALPPATGTVSVTFTARSGGSGGAGPFGGGGTPFTPLVLAKLGAPITWDPKSTSGHDADLTAKAGGASGETSVTLEIPEGTTADSIYVQIANTGTSNGAYDRVALSFASRDEAGDGSSEGDGEEPAAPAPVTTKTVTSGCATTPTTASASLLPALAAAAAMAARWRRRRSTER